MIKKIIKELYHIATLKILFPLQYKRFAKKPLEKNKAVFIEANLSQLSGSLTYVYDELKKRGLNLHTHFLKEAYVGKFSYIKNVFDCLEDIATAQYVFLCEGSRPISCITPRKETVIVQTWHGCGAFKKFGFSTIGFLFGTSERNSEKYSYYKNYDIVTVSSPDVVWAYKEAMNIPEKSDIVKPIGISRTDLFFDEKFSKSAKSEVIKEVPNAKDKKIILYAPTFRGNVADAKTADAIDIPAMKKALGNDYILLIKHHPVVKLRPEIPKGTEYFAFDVSDVLSIEQLLVTSDICISDYSSLVFEYSLFERPMIFFAYDLDEYTDWRGFYYNYEELTPGPVVKTTEEIIAYIKSIEKNFDKQKIIDFKQKFMSACDGKSTERLIDFVIRRADELYR